MAIPQNVRSECVRLRVEEHLSLKEIKALTGVSVGSLSAILIDYPLPEEVQALKRKRPSRRARKSVPREERFPNESPFVSFMKPLESLTRREKGRIAEAAVLLRLSLLGLVPAKPVFDGETSDWLVEFPGRTEIRRVQVKWLKTGKHGQPFAALTSTGSSGKVKTYTPADFDVLVGYDIRTDKCHVWDWQAIGERKTIVAVTPDSCEAWSRL